MLCREACSRCIEERHPDRVHFSMYWCNDKVECPFGFELEDSDDGGFILTSREPPAKCPYRLEHAVMCQTYPRCPDKHRLVSPRACAYCLRRNRTVEWPGGSVPNEVPPWCVYPFHHPLNKQGL